MPRMARAAVGLPHYITHRDNYRQNVSEYKKDRETYLC
jgi:hypothetical protein